MKRAVVYLSLVTVVLFVACNNSGHLQDGENKEIPKPFVCPAFADYDVPFMEYSLQAEKGDTFYSASGSVLNFPANSLMDNIGNLVKGQVSISYRELSDPVDMFISGIPMSYDSAGTNFTFESAGMFEIYAKKDNIQLMVNPKSMPEISLVSNNQSAGFNVYVLDTVQKKWINKGKSVATIVSSKASNKLVTAPPDKPNASFESTEIMPVKPERPSGKRPVVEIEIAPGSFPELQFYHNLKFEIAEEEKRFNQADAKIEWDNVGLKKGNGDGKYEVVFLKKQKRVSYIVRPVLDGKSYEDALVLFEAKSKKLRDERIAKEKLLSDLRKKYQEELAIAEKKQKELVRAEYLKGGSAMEGQIIRTFQLQGFGIWNSDRPMIQPPLALVANFIDESGKDLNLNGVTIFTKQYNTIFRYEDANIRMHPGNSSLKIFSVMGDKLVYLDPSDAAKYNVSAGTKKMTFTMKVHPDKITSNEELKKILGI
ncbi:MAG: hypothetical protein ACOYOA_12510 [Saprospiraceae bacterium]